MIEQQNVCVYNVLKGTGDQKKLTASQNRFKKSFEKKLYNSQKCILHNISNRFAVMMLCRIGFTIRAPLSRVQNGTLLCYFETGFLGDHERFFTFFKKPL